MSRVAECLVLCILISACASSTENRATPAAFSRPASAASSSLSSAEEAAATVQPLSSGGSLMAGTYVFANPYTDDDPVRDCERGCSAYDTIHLTLPGGWAIRDGLLHKHLGQPREVALSMWTVDRVYDDPCQWEASTLSELDLADHTHAADGSIVLGEGESGGLRNQIGRSASGLREVEFGGSQFTQPTLRLQLSVPPTLDLATCDRGEYRSWTEWDVPDGANTHHAAGQTDVVYMVDVDRRPFVIVASHRPTTSSEDLAELEQILASLRID